jgi:excisionase family DNA binding protein
MTSIPNQLTVKEASRLFNIPENTLRAYIFRRIIPFRRCRGKIFLVTAKLEEWLSTFDVEPINRESK